MFDDNKMLIYLSAVVTNKEVSDQVPFVLHMNTSEIKLHNISVQSKRKSYKHNSEQFMYDNINESFHQKKFSVHCTVNS